MNKAKNKSEQRSSDQNHEINEFANGSDVDYLPRKKDACRSCLLVRQSGHALTASQGGNICVNPHLRMHYSAPMIIIAMDKRTSKLNTGVTMHQNTLQQKEDCVSL
jgi:hypothetical protein